MSTTKAILIDLREKLATAYQANLDNWPFKTAVKGALIDGFRDGLVQMETHLIEMGALEIVDE